MSARPTSALLFKNRIPLPPELPLDAIARDQKVGVRAADGELRIEAPGNGADETHIVQRRAVVVPPTILQSFDWQGGMRISLVAEHGGITARALDPDTHPDFTDPLIGLDGLPLPPQYLVQAFTSVPDRVAGVRKGEETAHFILDYCTKAGRPLGGDDRFLDFGCGSGRVLRHMPRLADVDVIGTDLYADAITWCRRFLPTGTFIDGQERPSLPVEDNSVDVMLALSVLTHLDEELCRSWLADWKRMLKPGGLAFVTAHSDGLIASNFAHVPQRQEQVRTGMQENGGVWFDDSAAWKGIFPDIYQTTYHSEEHIRSVWGSIMEIIDIVPSGGFTNRQDLVVMRA